MRLSTKGRYGLRAMIDLAINSKGEQVALYSIAERQNISVSYLEQVFAILRKSGLVNSIKGAQGGYMVADDPSNITVGTILRALEGNLSVVEESEELEDTRSVEYCLRINVWDKINESINNVVDSMTLEDLVEEYKRMNGKDNLMFYI
ncbi:transcriptional regulator, Rrf2 family [Gottschalkia acidurici 9a]|uniref:Transcriptional regulator, Rrf2 family n=1 Tax=Gottschalkia acidurici (strain ATCC 7906 / DSM 604 / BCRC 14475 / CIP 104303 / KCTC 5404 / NCIMB 10678 / 9a) TaxID=1128398 RepID=K0B2C8_GOTA9|nr:Rrf2 family transcriptional regulator [Gottschalkia acidurici]AFS79649.1 transcriptional regulator, Rrf2 family [Gottschalkia acidurici 9a]